MPLQRCWGLFRRKWSKITLAGGPTLILPPSFYVRGVLVEREALQRLDPQVLWLHFLLRDLTVAIS